MLGLSIHKYENLKLTHKIEGTRKGETEGRNIFEAKLQFL